MLPPAQIARILDPYLPQSEQWSDLYNRLATFLDLLLKWNARTNLTAIRDAEEIVRRHFGESLFAAQHLGLSPSGPTSSLLDYGSGAGFPGIPIQLLHPTLHVTLAESQGKKASFLREVTRQLALPTEIWPHRVDALPPTRRFDIVTLRAVDAMAQATEQAAARSTDRLLILTTRPLSRAAGAREALPLSPPIPTGFEAACLPLPLTDRGVLLVARRTIVPRGTI